MEQEWSVLFRRVIRRHEEQLRHLTVSVDAREELSLGVTLSPQPDVGPSESMSETPAASTVSQGPEQTSEVAPPTVSPEEPLNSELSSD